MNLQGIIILAIGLSMVNFSMAFLSSFFKCQDVPGTLKISIVQAGFQAGLFVLGWLVALPFRSWLGQMAWPLVIFIFLMLGLKMILISRKARPTERAFDLSQSRILVGVAFASGINAFIIGMALGLINAGLMPFLPVLAIASFVLTVLGVVLGKVSGNIKYGQVAESIGGFLVIFIGIMLLLSFTNII